jgi:hypothetical protein
MFESLTGVRFEKKIVNGLRGKRKSFFKGLESRAALQFSRFSWTAHEILSSADLSGHGSLGSPESGSLGKKKWRPRE